MATRVLITDGEQRAALALVRSLGSAGYDVVVAANRPHSIAGASRHTTATAQTPDALREPAAFVAALRHLVRQHAIDVLIPISEAALLAVLAARDSFAETIIPFADIATFRRVCDKRDVLRVAADVGIAVPHQREVGSAEEARVLDLHAAQFPLVLKPARSISGENGNGARYGVDYAESMRQLREKLERLPSSAFPVLLQRRITGPGLGIFLLVWDGELVASFAHRRLREKPPSGGVSVYSESVPADPGLVEQSLRLLRAFDWRGVAMVEYKLDVATGVPFLMEINGRFWGSLQLAIDSGVDFPALLLSAAQRKPIARRPAYRLGVRCRWWWGDVDQLLTRLRHSSRTLSLPPDAPSRINSILSFLRVWRPGDRNEILRWRDPAPFVRESLDRLSSR